MAKYIKGDLSDYLTKQTGADPGRREAWRKKIDELKKAGKKDEAWNVFTAGPGANWDYL